MQQICLRVEIIQFVQLTCTHSLEPARRGIKGTCRGREWHWLAQESDAGENNAFGTGSEKYGARFKKLGGKVPDLFPSEMIYGTKATGLSGLLGVLLLAKPY